MPTSFTTKQSWLLILVGVLCGAIIVLSFTLVRQLIEANWWVNHTVQVMREADDSLLCLVDCETAYRGFLITGKEQYLEPFKNCEKHTVSHIQTLEKLTEDNPQQQRLMPVLVRIAKSKIDFSREVIKLRRANQTGKADSLLDLDPGKKLMDEYRNAITSVVQEENELYVTRVQSAKSLQASVLVLISMMAALIAGALLWIGLTSRRFAAEQESARQALSEARDDAIQANELKSQFVANISHEIRTPLSGVLGMSELLSRSETDPEKKDMVDHVFKSAQNLLFIVNDLLDFSKLEAGRITLSESDFSLQSLIGETIKSIEASARAKNLVINKVIDPALAPSYVGDANRLRQVLLNLAHNAVKFTVDGSVSFTASLDGQSGARHTIRMQVQDTGIGISKDERSRLFQPFVQADGSTSRKYGGTGLGLSICKKIVELMGGTIGIESGGAGQGSSFWFVVSLEVATAPVEAQ
jgi:signal transduction histidine kinase